MTVFIGLLRPVNVGGTGQLPMSDFRSLCETAGFRAVRTYIASGNVVFQSEATEAEVKAMLEEKLRVYAGKPVGLLVRTAGEMAAVLARNPFPQAAASSTVAIFLEEPPPASALGTLTGRQQEQLWLGQREIYVQYGHQMGRSKLRIPAARHGTAHNMNTVAKLASMAADEAVPGPN